MYRDPRGGHNRKRINENFFKTWSPQMAYVLGLIYSDGAIEDVRKSSRTCYWTISSNDKSLLLQVKRVTSSNHRLYIRKPRWVKFGSRKTYLCAKSYTLRVGNKNMYKDLIKLGLVPKKSLIIKFPNIPPTLFSHFLRGYFDGDGCVMVTKPKHWKAYKVGVIFTSGCKNFLEGLSNTLDRLVKTSHRKPLTNGEAYQLAYKKHNSLKILSYMYSNLKNAPYLDRKYQIYHRFLNSSSY